MNESSERPRGGRLRTVRRLLTVMLVLNVLALVAAVAVRLTGQVVAWFEVYPWLMYGPELTALERANPEVGPYLISVYVRDPSAVQTILGLLAHGLAEALVTVPMIISARRLVDRAMAGDPFTTSMVRGLRRLGLIVIIGGIAAELVGNAAVAVLRATAVSLPWHPLSDPNTELDLWWLLLGLVVLGFAQIVEHGRTLRAELDEVI